MKKALLGLMIFACVFFSVSCSTNKSTPTYSVTVLSTSSTTTLKTTVEETTTTEETTENGEIMWNDAIDHVGEYATVVGEVKSIKYSSYSNGSPTFINIGEDYPNSYRFSPVIWGKNRNTCLSVLDEIYYGDTVAITGYIETYNGVAQIEISSPSQIEIR